MKHKTINLAAIFLVCCLLFIACVNGKNPLGYDNSFTVGKGVFGKVISDFDSYVILKPDSTLWTWGQNWNGELGHGGEEILYTPTQIEGIKNIIDVDLYAGMCLAADIDGNVWLWGSNMYSSIAKWPKILSPRKIASLPNVKKVYLNGYHLLKNDGTVWKIEIDSQADSSFYTPQVVAGANGIIAISGPFALKIDGTIMEIMPSKEPAWGGLVSVQNVVAIQNSTDHTVVLKSNGTVWAWGQNRIGDLGNGTFTQSTVPTQVKKLKKIVQISTNYGFNLALDKDGSVWFWGFTTKRDANDKPIGINVPVKVPGLENATYVHAGVECMVLKSDGTYWAFNPDTRIPYEITTN